MHLLRKTALLALACSLAARADDAILKIKFGSANVQPLKTQVSSGSYTVSYPTAVETEVVSTLPVERSVRGEAMTLSVPFGAGKSVVEKTTMEAGRLVLSLYFNGTAPTATPSSPTLVSNPSAAGTAPPPAAAQLLAAAGFATPAGTSADPIANALKEALKAPPLDPAAKADFALPLSPAAAVLSDTTEVVRPVTPREFGSSILSHFNKDGTLASGFSIAAVPYFLLRGQEVDIRDYRKDKMVQFWSRLQLSAAAQASSGSGANAQPALFSLGLSGMIFDEGDLRLDEQLDQDFTTAFTGALDGFYAGGARPVLGDNYLKNYDTAIASARKRHWNSASLGFGAAPRWQSANGDVRKARYAGGAAWVGLSEPGFGSLKDNSQFLFQAQYRFSDLVPPTTPTGPVTKQDSLSIGAQFRFGTPDFNGFAEAFYKRRWTAGQNSKGNYTYEIGLERRLYKGVWLVLSYANDNDAATTGAQASTIKTGLRYGFGDGPKLKQ